MRLYVSMQLEADAPGEYRLSDAEKRVRVAVSPAGAVRQLLELADRTDLPHSGLAEDPHGVAAHLSTLSTVYDVSEHDLDVGEAVPAADAVPASLSDAELAEMHELMGAGLLNARSRSLIKRFNDAPLPHQVRTPDQLETYWSEIEKEIGIDRKPPRAGGSDA